MSCAGSAILHRASGFEARTSGQYRFLRDSEAPACLSYRDCPAGFLCDALDYECRAASDLYEPCGQPGQLCKAPLVCACESGVSCSQRLCRPDNDAWNCDSCPLGTTCHTAWMTEYCIDPHTIGLRSSCDSDKECVTNSYCDRWDRACEIRAQQGEGCDMYYPCWEGGYCGDGHCASQIPLGEPCPALGANPCVEGAFCDASLHLCTTFPALGEPCAEFTWSCAAGLKCMQGLSDGVCRTFVSCDSDLDCAGGETCQSKGKYLYQCVEVDPSERCQGDSCGPYRLCFGELGCSGLLPPYARCGQNADRCASAYSCQPDPEDDSARRCLPAPLVCGETTCKSDEYCHWELAGSFCAPRAAEGQDCDYSTSDYYFGCALGLGCRAETMTCGAAGTGQVCDSSDSCGDGLFCGLGSWDIGECQARLPVGAPCPADSIDSNHGCSLDALCNQSSHLCERRFELSELCWNDNQGPLRNSCAPGLACVKTYADGVCR